MTDSAHDAHVAGVATLPVGTYEGPERDLATQVTRGAVDDAGVSLADIEGVYMPKPRPWTKQKFFSTMFIKYLGLDVKQNLEVYTGGTSGGKALHGAVADVRSGRLDTALVLAVEIDSTVETERYFEYIVSIFDREFQSPFGPSVPGIYAQSLQRYMHEYGVSREDIASIVVKNRDNAASNPEALFDSVTDTEAILTSEIIADPLRLYECPVLCDGAAALVVTSDPDGPRISGIGHHHPPSHLSGVAGGSMASLPAVQPSAEKAFDDAKTNIEDVDVLEPYAPFPHIEAILTEELGLFDRGDGATACARGETRTDGSIPVSPSGGCIGRGHPAMVTPLLNHAAAVRQLRGTASNQIPGTSRVLTTSEHGHVDGMTTTIFEEGDT
jgi:acetyl-CoA C-acetyltransferase